MAKPKEPLEELGKYADLYDRYADSGLTSNEIDQAYRLKQAFMAEKGESRVNRKPQDIAVEIIKAEKERGVTLLDDKRMALFFLLGNPVEGDLTTQQTLEYYFQQQERSNAKNAATVASLSDAVASQAANASKVDEQI